MRYGTGKIQIKEQIKFEVYRLPNQRTSNYWVIRRLEHKTFRPILKNIVQQIHFHKHLENRSLRITILRTFNSL